MWVSQIVHSFQWAGRGLGRALRDERNLRIHSVALCYAVWAGFLAGLDGPRWGAVLLTCGAVIGAELMNTAIENLCDALHPEQHPKIGAAKDAAAAAVLVLAGMAVCVGVAVLGPWLLQGGLTNAIRDKGWLVPVFLFSLVPSGFFIVLPHKSTPKNSAQ